SRPFLPPVSTKTRGAWPDVINVCSSPSWRQGWHGLSSASSTAYHIADVASAHRTRPQTHRPAHAIGRAGRTRSDRGPTGGPLAGGGRGSEHLAAVGDRSPVGAPGGGRGPLRVFHARLPHVSSPAPAPARPIRRSPQPISSRFLRARRHYRRRSGPESTRSQAIRRPSRPSAQRRLDSASDHLPGRPQLLRAEGTPVSRRGRPPPTPRSIVRLRR